jgi:hypothetical protein
LINSDFQQKILYSNTAEKPQIIFEKRSTIAAASFVQWTGPKDERRIEKAAFAFAIYDDDKLIKQDVWFCANVDSVHQLELWGIQAAFPFLPENDVVMIKLTQTALINGINTDLDYWIANDGISKGGIPVKHFELWQALNNERERRQLIALQLEEQELKKLQAVAKACVFRNLV